MPSKEHSGNPLGGLAVEFDGLHVDLLVPKLTDILALSPTRRASSRTAEIAAGRFPFLSAFAWRRRASRVSSASSARMPAAALTLSGRCLLTWRSAESVEVSAVGRRPESVYRARWE